MYKTIILLVILYGCETWSPTLREELGLRGLKRIFGPERKEVVGGWRRLHNKEHHNTYASLNIIRMMKQKMRLGGNVARMGEMRNAYNI